MAGKKKGLQQNGAQYIAVLVPVNGKKLNLRTSEKVLSYKISDDLPLSVLRGLEEQAAASVGHKVHQFRGPVIRTCDHKTC